MTQELWQWLTGIFKFHRLKQPFPSPGFSALSEKRQDTSRAVSGVIF